MIDHYPFIIACCSTTATKVGTVQADFLPPPICSFPFLTISKIQVNNTSPPVTTMSDNVEFAFLNQLPLTTIFNFSYCSTFRSTLPPPHGFQPLSSLPHLPGRAGPSVSDLVPPPKQLLNRGELQGRLSLCGSYWVFDLVGPFSCL